MGHEQVLRFGDERNESEIAHRIERELHERRVGRVPRCIEQDGVTVGHRARADLRGDRRIRPAAIVDDHLLAEVFTELGRHDARHDVIGAAGRKPDQEPDGLGGIGLRVRRGSRSGARHEDERGERVFHEPPPSGWWTTSARNPRGKPGPPSCRRRPCR
jgi:hypothetical protein